MTLLPGWADRLAARASAKSSPVVPPIALTAVDARQASASVLLVHDADDARALVDTLSGLPIAAVALDARRPRPVASGAISAMTTDRREQRPSQAAMAALCHDGEIVLAVLDLRVEAAVEALVEILRLHAPIVVHGAKPLLFGVWALGIDLGHVDLVDTYLTGACLALGRDHDRAAAPDDAGDFERIQAEGALRERRERRLTLAGQCEEHGLRPPVIPRGGAADLPGPESDTELAQSILRRAALRAEWTLRLHLAQQPAVVRAGVAHHLLTVEYPFAIANARMEWHGVPADAGRCQAVRLAARRAARHYANELEAGGVTPAGGREAFLRVMRERGLARHLSRGRALVIDDRTLESVEHHDPLIRAFRLHRRYARLAGETWLRGAGRWPDGRLHPEHVQLGAATGRNSCRRPNLAGIGRVMRPVVTAPPGRAIVELDYAQIEIAVAAAEHGDRDLLAAYHAGDVYAAMAQRYYAARLPESERALGALAFARARPDLRARMKTCVLAILYNIQAPGLAARLGCTVADAKRERARLADTYPVLWSRMRRSTEVGLARGYATVVSGARRQLPEGKSNGAWKRNLLRNTPVQGSAAVIFKRAVIDLDLAFRGTSTKLVLPLHDAVVIECDSDKIDGVAAEAARIMRHAARVYYPLLEMRINVNRACPSCWNKDGHADSLERFIEDPTFSLDAPGALRAAVVRELGAGMASVDGAHADAERGMRHEKWWSACVDADHQPLEDEVVGRAPAEAGV